MTARKRKLILVNPGSRFVTLAKGKVFRYPNLGLAYIAALTPDHWDIEMLDENFDEVKFKECDLVGISVKTTATVRAYEIAALFREKKVPVIMGGAHPTMAQEETLQHADTIVVGEAENTWPQVIKDFETGNLKKIYNSPGFSEMSKLVLPRKDLFDKRYHADIIQTTRGCPFNCEFCAIQTVYGKKYRKRPIDDIIQELKLSRHKFLAFVDDNLIGFSKKDFQRFIELCKAMVKNKIKKNWFGQASMNCFDNDEVLYWAKKAGCKFLIVGIESWDREVLAGTMNKNVNAQYINKNLTKKSHRYGIAWGVGFIVGNDEDTPDTFAGFPKFINENNIDVPQFGFLTPYPGTQLEKRLEDEMRLTHRKLPHDWQYYFAQSRAFFDTKHMTMEEIDHQMRTLARKNFAYRNILKRTLKTLLYSRNFVTTMFVLGSNYLARKMHFNAPYYKNKGA